VFDKGSGICLCSIITSLLYIKVNESGREEISSDEFIENNETGEKELGIHRF